MPSTATMSIGDPAPLGLVAFGLTTMALSVINAGWIDKAATPGVLSLALAFGGATQLLAGMWAFRRGNTFAATAFSSYGAFWISFWLLNVLYVPQIKTAGAVGAFLGVYLFLWGVFTAYMLVASLAGARGVSGVFLLLSLTFFALCIGAFWSADWANKLGGYLGILTAINAMYVSFADVTNANFKRRILPT